MRDKRLIANPGGFSMNSYSIAPYRCNIMFYKSFGFITIPARKQTIGRGWSTAYVAFKEL